MKYLFKKYCDNGFWILAPILNIYKAYILCIVLQPQNILRILKSYMPAP